MKNLNEQIERINNLSNYMVGVVISEQEENTSNYKTGESYKYQFINSETKKPVNAAEVKVEKGTIPQTYYSLPSTGMIKVKSTHSGGDIMVDFQNNVSLDLQYKDGEPNTFNHPDFTTAKVNVKLFPN